MATARNAIKSGLLLIQRVQTYIETQYENPLVMPAHRGLFKVSDYLSSSGVGAFILKQRLRKVKDLLANRKRAEAMISKFGRTYSGIHSD